MKHPWSYSTTVRNPERLRDFLRVLQELEGQPFNVKNQIKFQTLLIKHKFYKPTDLTPDQESYFDEIEKEMPLAVAEKIFNAQNYKDPSMRGRQSANPLNKMGLSIAKGTAGPIKITDFGRYFLSENYDLGEIFFIHFLKWQAPNLDSDSFTAKDGFAIKPFIGTLHLINKVNEMWKQVGNKPVGLSKEEFTLFGPTLINYKDITTQARNVVLFREGLAACKDKKARTAFKSKFKKNFAANFLGTNEKEPIEALIDNLKDYGDNAIRYFRLTRYITIRGNGFYIDLEPRRSVEITKLLETDNAAPVDFPDLQAYLDYISDIRQPVLPWETEKALKAIVDDALADIKGIVVDLKKKGVTILEFKYKDTKSLSIDKLKIYVQELRDYRRLLQDTEIHYNSQDVKVLQEYIAAFKNIYEFENRPRELEKLANLALNALNDALAIKPNYPVGDDNEPTFTAPAGKPDIECFYKSFNGICEVTMLTDRSQWYNEGQPVMRHIRDFETDNGGKNTYCLFIAPKLHTDTMETFWMAIKHGYKGAKQNIVPLSIKQFITLLEILLEMKQKDKKLTHLQLLDLYKNILSLTDNVEHSDEWLVKIPAAMEAWKENALQ